MKGNTRRYNRRWKRSNKIKYALAIAGIKNWGEGS